MNQIFVGWKNVENILSVMGPVKTGVIVPNESSEIFAELNSYSYEEDARIIFTIGDKIYEVQAAHCSCNDFDETWEPHEVTIEYLNIIPNVFVDENLNNAFNVWAESKLRNEDLKSTIGYRIISSDNSRFVVAGYKENSKSSKKYNLNFHCSGSWGYIPVDLFLRWLIHRTGFSYKGIEAVSDILMIGKKAYKRSDFDLFKVLWDMDTDNGKEWTK